MGSYSRCLSGETPTRLWPEKHRVQANYRVEHPSYEEVSTNCTIILVGTLEVDLKSEYLGRGEGPVLGSNLS